MKTISTIQDSRFGRGPASRSVLECGGKSEATPLSHAGRFTDRSQPSSARKLRRRCALPEQSKTWRQFVAATRQSAALFRQASHRRFPKRRYAALALLLGFIMLHSSFCLRAAGQSYSIDWSKIAGGGGTSTGGVYSVSGTIGQPDAGKTSGGDFTIDGGFWGIIAVVQTPGAPPLAIARTMTNTVAVSWPSPSINFSLQQNTNNVASVNWSNVVTAPLDDGTTKTVIVNPPTGNCFYRLFKP